jgi:hypothetical protein
LLLINFLARIGKKGVFMSRGVIEKDLVLLVNAKAELSKTAIIDALGFGFNVKLTIAGEDQLLMNARRRKEVRVFKTIDAAVRCCRAVGISGPLEVLA